MVRPKLSSRILPGYIRFHIWALVLLLTVFLGFRLLFYGFFADGEASASQIKGAMGIGMHMDLMVSAYILVIPFILLSIKFLFKLKSARLEKAALAVFILLFTVSILLCSADIPYYSFFKSRITTSIMLWIDDFSQSIRFVFSEKKFYPFILIFLVLGTLSLFVFRFIISETIRRERFVFGWMHRTVVFVVSGVLLLYAMRGAQIYRPIGIRNAFFTNEAFVNHLALNPVLTFFDSFSEFQFKVMDEKEAIAETSRNLGVTGSKFDSPIARPVVNEPSHPQKNIVIVLMEGMSASQMGVFGNAGNLTPYLDSLALKGMLFQNFYSCGIHTCNGIYGTLFGMPSVFSRHPMANIKASDQRFYGLPQVLKSSGYRTLFVCSHHQEFDNLGYFLPRNGIDELVSLKDFPREVHENVWGVNDETLFAHSISKMDSLAATGSPFLSVILTISTHPPQAMPRKTSFRPKSTTAMDQVFEYADFALRRFMEDAGKKPWYENTLFAFVGDHGINKASALEAPLALNHVPLIIFDPSGNTQPAKYTMPGTQTDIFPTLLRLNGTSYINNTLGVDLLEHQRPYAFFSQDKRLCVINHDYYLVIDKSGMEIMYRLYKGDYYNYINEERVLADKMKKYAFSMLQTAQHMIDNRLVGKP